MVALAVAAGGCGAGGTAAPTTIPAPASTTVTSQPAATTTSTARATTTTLGPVPVAPQPSAQIAADALVSGWADRNRPVALSVASPAAVATLFAVPYPSGLAGFRGCTGSFLPLVCTYGPPGGGPASDPVFQLYLSQTAKGWYVGSVQIES
jgi:hypothetical protein